MAKQTTDEAVMKLLRTVQQKKDEIANASKKPQWKTNCTIGFNPESATDRINIMTVTNQTKITNLYAFLLEQEEYMQRAAADLGVELNLTYMAYPIEEWKDDLKTRTAQLGLEQKKKDLAVLDKRVNSLVSPDQRREMELQSLQEVLGI